MLILSALLIGMMQKHALSYYSPLYEESNFLLKSESVTAVNYFSIIKTIADGIHKLGKIAGTLGQETSTLTPYLATLIDLRFVEKRTPVTEKIQRSRVKVSILLLIFLSDFGSAFL